MDSIKVCTNCCKDPSDYLTRDGRQVILQTLWVFPEKYQASLPSLPLRKTQNSPFDPAKPSQSTKGLSLKAIRRIHTQTVPLRISCAFSQEGRVGETDTGDCCELKVLRALSPSPA